MNAHPLSKGQSDPLTNKNSLKTVFRRIQDAVIEIKLLQSNQQGDAFYVQKTCRTLMLSAKDTQILCDPTR